MFRPKVQCLVQNRCSNMREQKIINPIFWRNKNGKIHGPECAVWDANERKKIEGVSPVPRRSLALGVRERDVEEGVEDR